MATLPIANPQQASVLVCLPSMPTEAQDSVLDHVRTALPGNTLIASTISGEGLLDYTSPRSQLGWVLAAGDYASAATLAQQHNAAAILILGADARALSTGNLQQLAATIHSGADLALPTYDLNPHEGLVTSAMLYPLTRALFGADVRFPLPLDAALSPRMLQRLAARSTAPLAAETLLWPVAEAAVASFSIKQVNLGKRSLPAPTDTDLNTLLAAVAGSLFADIESKASFWQRARAITLATAQANAAANTPSLTSAEELKPMLDSFRLAANNLGEIWSLVLPPQTLVALKKLARLDAPEFTLDPSLWARIVYDFALAFRLRTLNRGHLLGAMTPLYLAWVASHLRLSGEDRIRATQHIEATAQAFEREKPYLVSRWRWPDRFNP